MRLIFAAGFLALTVLLGICIQQPIAFHSAIENQVPLSMPSARKHVLSGREYDLNGDGQKDFLGIYHDKREVSLLGSAVFPDPEPITASVLIIEINGKVEEYVLEDISITANEWRNYPFIKMEAGDYDGDGRMEIALFKDVAGQLIVIILHRSSEGSYHQMPTRQRRYSSLVQGLSFDLISTDEVLEIKPEFKNNNTDPDYDYDEYSNFSASIPMEFLLQKALAQQTNEAISSRITSAHHLQAETIPYSGQDAMLCRQPVGDYVSDENGDQSYIQFGYIWYICTWHLDEKDVEHHYQIRIQEEWFQPLGADRDELRGFANGVGCPRVILQGNEIHDGSSVGLSCFDIDDDYWGSFRITYNEKHYTNGDVVVLVRPYEQGSKDIRSRIHWGASRVLKIITMDVTGDGLRDAVLLGEFKEHGKSFNQLAILDMQGEGIAFYPLRLDRHVSVIDVEIKPYHNGYIMNCLLSTPNDQTENWQAFQWKDGIFEPLSEEAVIEGFPFSLFVDGLK